MIDPSIRLRRAIRANDFTLVRRILASHPHLLHNPDTSNPGLASDGLSNSNLHLAASLGHLAICQLLVDDLGHERDPDTGDSCPALNEHYETALMLAARAGHTETVHFLCQADPSGILRRDQHGRDAIMEAARGGHDTVVQILLTYAPGGAVEAVRREDVDGNTALHFASSCGHLLVLRTLLAAGADASHENVWRWTPVAYSASVQAEVYLRGLISEVEKRRQQERVGGAGGGGGGGGILSTAASNSASTSSASATLRSTHSSPSSPSSPSRKQTMPLLPFSASLSSLSFPSQVRPSPSSKLHLQVPSSLTRKLKGSMSTDPSKALSSLRIVQEEDDDRRWALRPSS